MKTLMPRQYRIISMNIRAIGKQLFLNDPT